MRAALYHSIVLVGPSADLIQSASELHRELLSDSAQLCSALPHSPTMPLARPMTHQTKMLSQLSLMQLLLLILFASSKLGAHASPSSPSSSSSSSASPQCTVSDRIAYARTQPPSSRLPHVHFYDDEGVNYPLWSVWFGESGYLRCPVACSYSVGRDEKWRFRHAEAVTFWATPFDKGVNVPDDKCNGSIWMAASTEASDESILDRSPPGGPMPDGRPSPIDLEVSWRRWMGEDKVSWLNNYDWNLDFNELLNATDADIQALLPHTKSREGRDADQACVAAFISNCGASTPRLEILRELQKHIRVDSFGTCAHNKDIPDHWSAEEKDLSRGVLMQKVRILKRRYKFLLAFENTETDDYVTEKFYHPLHSGIVPIVLGPSNIDLYSPAHPGQHPAFINVRDFANMADLAALIDELDRNDTAYLSYFDWRRSPQLPPLLSLARQYSWLESPCQVCQTLHERLYGTKPISIEQSLYERHRWVERPQEGEELDVKLRQIAAKREHQTEADAIKEWQQMREALQNQNPANTDEPVDKHKHEDL